MILTFLFPIKGTLVIINITNNNKVISALPAFVGIIYSTFFYNIQNTELDAKKEMLIRLLSSPMISIIVACLGMLFLVSSFFNNNNNNFMFNFGQAEAISFPLRNIENFKSIDLAGDGQTGLNP